jgi:multidrug transporter EmrE-like cation transporter
MGVLAVSLDVVALLVLGWARIASTKTWSRTGLFMIAGSLVLLSLAVWLAFDG